MKSAIVVTFMRVLLVLSILGGFLYYFWVKIYSFYLVWREAKVPRREQILQTRLFRFGLLVEIGPF